MVTTGNDPVLLLVFAPHSVKVEDTESASKRKEGHANAESGSPESRLIFREE